MSREPATHVLSAGPIERTQRAGPREPSEHAGRVVEAAAGGHDAPAGEAAAGGLADPAGEAAAGSPDGAATWAALAAAHAVVEDRLGAALLGATGLGITEFEVLRRIDGAPPPGTRLGELQPAIRLSQPALSRMAARLEQRGLLRRAGDPTDRRGIVLTITPSGRRALRRATAVHETTLRTALLDPLAPAGHERLTDLLRRITEGSAM
jgi:DNA-binding MarR family transcriptional regulator